MIDKAFGLQDACRNAVFADESRAVAVSLLHEHMTMTEDEMKQAIFTLMGIVASNASFETTVVLLDEKQQEELAHTIEMLNGMGEE